MTNIVNSMTAYATCQQVVENYGLITVEIKAVNSKYLDLSTKLPDYLGACEPLIRKKLTNKLKRGKIDLYLHLKFDQNFKLSNLYKDQIEDYLAVYNNIHSIADSHSIAVSDLSISDLIKHLNSQGISKLQFNNDSILHEAIVGLVDIATDKLLVERSKEGHLLSLAIQQILEQVQQNVAKLEEIAPAAKQEMADKFSQKLQEVTKKFVNNHNYDNSQDIENKIAQEVAAYLNKIDIVEELTRLKVHTNEVVSTIESGGVIGRKLDFLMQELMRETNTLSAKSVSIDFRNIAINLKVFIEQMREQIQNIE